MSRKLLLAATLLAAPLISAQVASAQPVTGLYIGAGGGANFLQQEQVRALTPPGSPGLAGRSSFDTGVVGLGSVGFGFGNGIRVEVEGDYRNNRYSSTGAPVGLTVGGREQKYGAMANALFDLDIGSPYVFPYIGAGVGYQQVDQHLSAAAGSARLGLSASEGSFAYQAIAGLSFPIPPVVGLSLTAEYRYLALAGDRDYSLGLSGGASGIGFSTIRTRADYNHSLLLGLRYAFNAAPPPAVAAAIPQAPAPTASRTYLVFFDWDRADLTDRARQIIAEAAQATTRVQVTRIEVNGYTDRSGTARYNQGLSVRRAQSVANELVRLGVPRASITTQGFGESNPLVPTADGVREPQNRRVEIILR